jgi:hypothetical protein
MKSAVSALVPLALLFAGCSTSPKSELQQLEKADSFELYSLEPLLDPKTGEEDYDPNGSGERLHGWRILGKTTVIDEAMRRELIGELKRGLGEDKHTKCFEPRHAIRRTNDGKPVDLIICFECGYIELHVAGKKVGDYTPFIANPSAFNEVLKKAGVPLAKEREKPKQ